jgi:hypothetical protein
MERRYKICDNCGASVLDVTEDIPVVVKSFTELARRGHLYRYCNSTDCIDVCFERIDENTYELIGTYFEDKRTRTATGQPQQKK